MSRWWHEWWPLVGAAALLVSMVAFAKYGSQ
jgi:hypothetical protein